MQANRFSLKWVKWTLALLYPSLLIVHLIFVDVRKWLLLFSLWSDLLLSCAEFLTSADNGKPKVEGCTLIGNKNCHSRLSYRNSFLVPIEMSISTQKTIRHPSVNQQENWKYITALIIKVLINYNPFASCRRGLQSTKLERRRMQNIVADE